MRHANGRNFDRFLFLVQWTDENEDERFECFTNFAACEAFMFHERIAKASISEYRVHENKNVKIGVITL